eukprot:4614267-Amphidinium_carterae.1
MAVNAHHGIWGSIESISRPSILTQTIIIVKTCNIGCGDCVFGTGTPSLWYMAGAQEGYRGWVTRYAMEELVFWE